MALPKLTIPTYDITLPISGKKLTARPFLVKEEKVLMIAFESENPVDIVRAINKIINDCVHEEISPNTLALVDVEYLIIKLKSFSRGESIDLTMKCGNKIQGEDGGDLHPCGFETDIAVSLENLGDDIDVDQILPASIKLSDNIGINLRPPRWSVMTTLLNKELPEGEHVMRVLVDSIESVWTDEEVFPSDGETYESMEEFIGEMNSIQFGMLKDYFASIPVVQLKEDFECPRCHHRETVNVRKLNDFFG